MLPKYASILFIGGVANKFYFYTETFELDISTTKKLLEGERGQLIRRKDIVVSDTFLHTEFLLLTETHLLLSGR